MCAGTHPFTDWQTQQISPKERYLQLVEQMQWPARRLQIFGVHVHVGVRAPEKAIPIVNALCQYLPHFLALSASSPVLEGRRHRPGLGAHQGLRGHAHGRPALPALRLGRVRGLHGDPDLHATPSRASARCGGTSARTPTSAPSSCASATGCPPSTRSARSPRCRSAWSSSSTPSSTAATRCPRPAALGAAGEQVAGGPLRPGRRHRRRREGHRAAGAAGDRSTWSRTSRPPRAGWAARPSSRDVERILAVGASYQRQRAVAAAHDGDLRAVVDSLLAELRDGLPAARARPGAAGGAPAARDAGRREAGRGRRRRGSPRTPPQLVAVRRHLHAHPELAFAEFETTSFLEQRLRDGRARAPAAARPAPGWSSTSGSAADGRSGGAARRHRRAAAGRPQGRALRLHPRGPLPRLRARRAHHRRPRRRARAGRARRPARHRALRLPAGRGDRPRRAPRRWSPSGVLDGASRAFALHCDPSVPVGTVGLRTGADHRRLRPDRRHPHRPRRAHRPPAAHRRPGRRARPADHRAARAALPAGRPAGGHVAGLGRGQRRHRGQRHPAARPPARHGAGARPRGVEGRRGAAALAGRAGRGHHRAPRSTSTTCAACRRWSTTRARSPCCGPRRWRPSAPTASC